jgi:hypothetical protein
MYHRVAQYLRARIFQGGEEKYRAVLLFDKTSDLSALKAAIIAARSVKFPGKDREFLKTL